MSDDTDRRVDDLEVRMAFLERTVQELDDVAREAHDEIAVLRDAIRKLTERLDQGADAAVHVGSPEDEVPPHY
jgi:uncharacterized coiled-coil protein SlyX